MSTKQISVPLKDAVAMTGIGDKALRAAIKSGDLAARYVGTKIIVEVEELREYVRSLPSEAGTR